MVNTHLERTEQPKLLQKDFLLAVVAGGMFILCDYLMLSFLPPFMVQEGYSDFMSGLQGSLFSLFCVFFRFYLAPMADTKGRKRLMAWGTVFFLGGCLILSRVLSGAGKAAYLSTASCYISDIIPPERRGIGIGIQRSMYSIALMTGPIGALKIIHSPYGYRGLFWVLVLAAFCVLVMVSLLKETLGKAEQQSDRLKDYGYLIRRKDIRSVYLLIVSVCLSLGACLSFITIYTGSLGIEEKTGVFFFWFAMAGLVGNLLGGHLSDRYSPKKLSFLLAYLSATGTAVLILLPGSPVIILVISAILGGVGNASTATVNWLVGLVSSRKRGVALGMLENFIDIGIALGALLFGLLAMFADYGMVFLVMGLIAFCINLSAGRLLRSDEKEEDTRIAV